MNKLKFWFVIIVILILNLIILFWREGIFSSSSKLSYGKRISKIYFFDANGNEINIGNNKVTVIYYASLAQNEEVQFAIFLENLYQRYYNHGLQVIGIFKRGMNNILELKNNNSISYPIGSSYANNTLIKKIFGSKEESKRLIIFLDQFNTIKFMSSIFSENDIRQLIEKFLLGEISYPSLNLVSSLKVGNAFPDILVFDLKSRRVVHFQNKKETLAIIVTGKCPDCIFSGFKSSFNLLEKLMDSKVNIAIIFSQRFLKEDILRNFGKVKAELFLAKDNIPEVEDLSKDLFYFNDPILVSHIDKNGNITCLESFDSFIEKIRQKKLPRRAL